jgi:hypothetical protein
VVHHQYPGVHWTKHPERFEKHMKKHEYADVSAPALPVFSLLYSQAMQNKATAFRNTHVFELFFLMILRDYQQMTDKWVDYSGTLSKEEITATIKSRLRGCWWGPRADKSVQLKGKEIGNYDVFGMGEDEDTKTK